MEGERGKRILNHEFGEILLAVFANLLVMFILLPLFISGGESVYVWVCAYGLRQQPVSYCFASALERTCCCFSEMKDK
jgi:hypothetical protein